MKIRSTLTGCALAAAVLISTPVAALAAPGDPEPIQFVPFDQATIYDPADVTPAVGGLLLTADGTDVCATNPESIALSDGTYPCFSDYGFSPGIPGARYAVDPPRLVPFDQATVVDPNTVTIVPGGLITAGGVDLCTANPGSIVFPDGRYPCYINFVQTYDYYPTPEEVLYDTPQVGQLPVGGADTGVAQTRPTDSNTSTVLGMSLLGIGVLSASSVLARRARNRR